MKMKKQFICIGVLFVSILLVFTSCVANNEDVISKEIENVISENETLKSVTKNDTYKKIDFSNFVVMQMEGR